MSEPLQQAEQAFDPARLLHERYMRRCIELARMAESSHDTLVGSLIVRNREVISEGVERVKANGDVTAHAEIEALKQACNALQSIDLSDCILYTTAEPCLMCSYAIRQAKVSQVVIGRPTPEIGGVSSRYPILSDAAISIWSRPPDIVTGVLQRECAELLRKK